MVLLLIDWSKSRPHGRQSQSTVVPRFRSSLEIAANPENFFDLATRTILHRHQPATIGNTNTIQMSVVMTKSYLEKTLPFHLNRLFPPSLPPRIRALCPYSPHIIICQNKPNGPVLGTKMKESSEHLFYVRSVES